MFESSPEGAGGTPRCGVRPEGRVRVVWQALRRRKAAWLTLISPLQPCKPEKNSGLLFPGLLRPPGVGEERAVHEEAIRKADVLVAALGYIRKFHGRFTVIKLGGSVMEDPESLRALLVDIVFMQTVGMRPVVVHGGGKAITLAMDRPG